MKSLHIAVIVKPTERHTAREDRNVGWWSYPVEPFTWDFVPLGKGKTVDTAEYKARGFDLIWHEDGGSWCDYIGHAIPTAYYAIDSTLSYENHYLPRKEQAAKADIVFVDHDRLERFENGSQPVFRALHCVNDKLFYPREKTLDVNFQCGGGSPERAAMRVQLDAICKAHDWSYKSGVSPLAEYAETMGRSKVVVVAPRTPTNRPHRVWDALASGAAVLSAPLPDVSREPTGDPIVRWGIYVGIFGNTDGLEHWLCELFEYSSELEDMQRCGQSIAQTATWSTRAAELRQLLSQELGL